MEFARELGTHFNCWCAASGVTDFDGLCNLIMLEQFKISVPERLAMYINEKKVKTVAEAAALTDDYLLTHKRGRGESPVFSESPVGGMPSWDRTGGRVLSGQRVDHVRESDDVCHMKGHWKKDCLV